LYVHPLHHPLHHPFYLSSHISSSPPASPPLLPHLLLFALPGALIYIPEGSPHATLNLEAGVGLAGTTKNGKGLEPQVRMGGCDKIVVLYAGIYVGLHDISFRNVLAQ
jgi:hypothetical protein